MRYKIHFLSGASPAERTCVRRAARGALSAEDTCRCVIEVLFTDDEGIRQLNAAHRGRDEPTDVLSFPLTDADTPPIPEPDGSPPVLGSVVINVLRCREQGIEYGHGFRRELCYLTVHSVLHLLGYNHERDEEKQVMRAKEEQIMQKLKLPRGKSPTGFFGVADAARGFFQGIRQERNIRVHLAAAVSVSVLGVYIRIDRLSWALAALCFGLVIGLELCNTALETLCDKVEGCPDARIKRCKDIAAGAVLAACLASLGVAAAIFIKPELWRGADPVKTAIIGGLVAVADALFIFLGGSEGKQYD